MPYALLVIAGERKGESFVIPEDRALTLGRDPSNDIRLQDRKLSRIHSQVQVIAGRAQVVDLNSTNGTMVNGTRIEGEIWLQIDDEVEVGMTRMRLIEMSPAAAESPTSNTAPAPTSPPVDHAVCEECGRAISDVELAANRLRKVGARFYCHKCAATFEEGTVSGAPPVEPLNASIVERGQPGKEIAGVRIIGLVGEGRLGPLYRAEQVSMGRLVALKMLNVTDADWAKKYLQAVYSSGQLVHANIALIFDTGEEDNLFYVVREYVEGRSAQERMANREPIPLPEAFGIVTQVCYALEHACERGIFHGGLSPRKVLLGARDAVKVTGFGLPLTPPPGRSVSAYSWHGLPYTPPERVRGEDRPDAAGDVYGAVAIFYHLLAGRAPFSGSTREKIEHRILTQTPRALKDHVPGLPEAAQKIIDRGLSKHAGTRYQTPRELLFDLEETLRREI